MGASTWVSFTPYHPKPSTALRQLREQIFALSHYRKPATVPERFNQLGPLPLPSQLHRQRAEQLRQLLAAGSSPETEQMRPRNYPRISCSKPSAQSSRRVIKLRKWSSSSWKSCIGRRFTSPSTRAAPHRSGHSSAVREIETDRSIDRKFNPARNDLPGRVFCITCPIPEEIPGSRLARASRPRPTRFWIGLLRQQACRSLPLVHWVRF